MASIFKQTVTFPVNVTTSSLILTNTTGGLGTPILYIPENGPSTPVKFTSAMLWTSL